MQQPGASPQERHILFKASRALKARTSLEERYGNASIVVIHPNYQIEYDELYLWD
jgi:hypothetical protein